MTREDVIRQFPDATDEQVSMMLNMVHKEVASEKEKNKALREKASKTDALQEELDKINEQNMSDIEKLQKGLEKLQQENESLKAENAKKDLKNSLATQGIVGEQADKFIESMGSGSFDASILGEIIENKVSSAIKEAENKLLDGTHKGGNTPPPDENKPADVVNAEALNFGSMTSDNKDYYVLKNN